MKSLTARATLVFASALLLPGCAVLAAADVAATAVIGTVGVATDAVIGTARAVLPGGEDKKDKK